MFRPFLLAFAVLVSFARAEEHRFLYVAVPGIRNNLEYGGHGVLVFDIDHGHRFVRRIPAGGIDAQGQPLAVRGICASAATGRLYVSTVASLECFDLTTDRLLWERKYEGGMDRMAITPDGKTIYAPSVEKAYWQVIDALTGDVIKTLPTEKLPHNTVISAGGTRAFLADRGSRLVQIADTAAHKVIGQLGPFGDVVRPFTTNGLGTRLYACVDKLLGFEMADAASGKVTQRVEVAGFQSGSVQRHGCPSHGIGLTPDERELWLADSFNKRMHVFDATTTPSKQLASIAVRDEPGWITFSTDGQLAWPSTGDVIDVHTRQIIATLTDEEGRAVQSEKLVEIDFDGARPVRNGDQFGIGQVTRGSAKKTRFLLVGDSTVAPGSGWGPGFEKLLAPDAECRNAALGGRSSKSFRDEGHWEPALAWHPDYVLLQFGHNDQPGKGPERETDPRTSYSENMARYVDEARAAGAQPILVTSLARRIFRDGKIEFTLTPYVEAVKKLAAEKHVPLIDLHGRSIAQLEAMGQEAAAVFDPPAKDGTPDHTHLNAKGADLTAALVVEELRKVAPEAARHLAAPR
jgi:lysophospholipase L1-like esterase